MTTHPTVTAFRFALVSCCLLTDSLIAQGLPPTAVMQLYEHGKLWLGGPAGCEMREAQRTMTHLESRFPHPAPHLPLAFSPGSRWNYGYSMDVLARVVDVVSGTTFDRYLDSALFRPLGMSMTAFHVTPAMEGPLTTAYMSGPRREVAGDRARDRTGVYARGQDALGRRRVASRPRATISALPRCC